MEFSRCTRAYARTAEKPACAGLSKLNSETSSHVEVDVDLGEPEVLDGETVLKTTQFPSTALAAPQE